MQKTYSHESEEIEKTLKRRARNPVTGKNEIIGNMSYSEWAEKNGLTNKPNNTTIKSNNYGFAKIKGTHTIDNDIFSQGLPTCNPKFNADYQYKVNCQRCVQTYEFRRRGYDVVAKPKPTKNNTIFWGNECFIDSNGNTPQYEFNQTEEQVKRELKNAPNGVRYSIYIKWKNSTGAHVFIGEKANGIVRYVDPQCGNIDVSSYFKSGSKGNFGYLRLDDKQLTTNTQTIFETMEGRK